MHLPSKKIESLYLLATTKSFHGTLFYVHEKCKSKNVDKNLKYKNQKVNAAYNGFIHYLLCLRRVTLRTYLISDDIFEIATRECIC